MIDAAAVDDAVSVGLLLSLGDGQILAVEWECCLRLRRCGWGDTLLLRERDHYQNYLID
jgi:hypothetical protein